MKKTPQLFSGKMQNHFYEIWLDVPGLEQFVMASNFGRIFFKTTGQVTDGTVRSLKIPYLSVKVNGKTYLVHRLVSMAFRPNPDKKSDINHITGITWFNWVGVIEWATRSENVIHSYRVLKRRRMLGVGYKVTSQQRTQIKELYQSGKFNQPQLAGMFKLGQTTISRIVRL